METRWNSGNRQPANNGSTLRASTPTIENSSTSGSMAAGSASSPAAPIPFIIRVLSGLTGVAVFAIGLVISFGAILASPLGTLLARRWAKRHDRPPTRISSLVGAVLASAALGVLLWSALFALMPRPRSEDLDSALRRSQSSPAVRLPDWYTKAFPQAAAAESASQQMIRSPEFRKMTFLLASIFAGVFFGVLGGVTGWGALSLLRVGWYGRRAA